MSLGPFPPGCGQALLFEGSWGDLTGLNPKAIPASPFFHLPATAHSFFLV